MSSNFAVIGVAGYIAPRHLKAIRDTGNRIVAAVDPSDSVGRLDRYSFDVSFFREFERFDRHVEKLRRGPEEGRVEYISICSPNYLHDAHIRFALRTQCHAICEKPLVVNPWNCDALQALEEESGRRVYVVLQLRLHPAVQALREKVRQEVGGKRHKVKLTYITPRGKWYLYSWKGDPEKGGGLATNIGIHFFDVLLWIFGKPTHSEVTTAEATRVAGNLALERADVEWFLSVDSRDISEDKRAKHDLSACRRMEVDGEPVDFSVGFEDLHTKLYADALAGRGFGIADARPAIDLVHGIREAGLVR
jgi:UDP-N-acetyl-2-amino-2-deoxyglucuronate dehydrogenase